MARKLTQLKCDASGQCTPQVTDCTPYNCDGMTACHQSCATMADCAPSFTCNAGTCQ
jgi:hypothetical protein